MPTKNPLVLNVLQPQPCYARNAYPQQQKTHKGSRVIPHTRTEFLLPMNKSTKRPIYIKEIWKKKRVKIETQDFFLSCQCQTRNEKKNWLKKRRLLYISLTLIDSLSQTKAEKKAKHGSSGVFKSDSERETHSSGAKEEAGPSLAALP